MILWQGRADDEDDPGKQDERRDQPQQYVHGETI